MRNIFSRLNKKFNQNLNPGDLVTLPNNGNVIFVGVRYLAKCKETHSRNPDFNYYPAYGKERVPQFFTTINMKSDLEPYYLFMGPDLSFNRTTRNEYLARRKPKKYTVVSSGNSFKEPEEAKIYHFYGGDYFFGMSFKNVDDLKKLDIEKVEWPREEYYREYPIKQIVVEK